MKVKDVLFGFGIIILGTATIILGVRNSKLSGEVEILKDDLTKLNRICDDKNRYIGKILTELKKS